MSSFVCKTLPTDKYKGTTVSETDKLREDCERKYIKDERGYRVQEDMMRSVQSHGCRT